MDVDPPNLASEVVPPNFASVIVTSNFGSPPKPQGSRAILQAAGDDDLHFGHDGHDDLRRRYGESPKHIVVVLAPKK